MKRISKPLRAFTSHLLRRMLPCLEESQLPIFFDALSSGLGESGATFVEAAAKEARECLQAEREKEEAKVRAETEKDIFLQSGRKRRPGGGRKKVEISRYPDLKEALTEVILTSSGTSSDSPLYYTQLGARSLSDELLDLGYDVSHTLVKRRLEWMGYTSHLRNGKGLFYISRADGAKQFESIADTAGAFLAAGDPVISVFKSGKMISGLESSFSDMLPVYIEIAPDPQSVLGITLHAWWHCFGKKLFPESRRLYVTTDRVDADSFRLWSYFLQMLADAEGLDIQVSHYPPGVSRWKEIAHRFSAYASKCVGGEATREILATVCLAGPCKMMDMVHPGSMAGSTGCTEPHEMSDTEDAVVLPHVPALVSESAESLDGTSILFEPDDVWNYTIHPGK